MDTLNIILFMLLLLGNAAILFAVLTCIHAADTAGGVVLTRENGRYLLAVITVYCAVLVWRYEEGAGIRSLWMTYLLIMAATDAQTGFVYPSISFLVNAVSCFCGAGKLWRAVLLWPRQELLILLFYAAVILFLGVLHGIGEGDIPVLISILLYHLLYSPRPGLTVWIFFALSQILFCAANLPKLGKKFEQPLIPYVAMSHFLVSCLLLS